MKHVVVHALLFGAFAFTGSVAGEPEVTQKDAASGRDARIARNAELGRRYFQEVWNGGNVAALDELLAPTYVNHTPSTPDPPPGPRGLKPIVLAIRQAFPDLHYEIRDVIATEDAVVIRTVMTGTHRGDLFGVRATGRRVSVDQINIERIRDGRIVDHWRVTDELKLMRELGVVK